MKKNFDNLKAWQIWLIIIVLIGLFLKILSPDTDTEQIGKQDEEMDLIIAEAEKTLQEAEDVLKEEDANVSYSKNWTYEVKVDEMTSKKAYFAFCKSDNILNFDFPYNGGSTFFLNVRNDKGKTDVYVTVSQGQFLTSFDGKSMRVKFDDEAPVNYSYVGAADGSADVIFISSAKKFLNKLKSSKKVSMEPEFYQSGRQIVKFSVENLEWDH